MWYYGIKNYLLQEIEMQRSHFCLFLIPSASLSIPLSHSDAADYFLSVVIEFLESQCFAVVVGNVGRPMWCHRANAYRFPCIPPNYMQKIYRSKLKIAATAKAATTHPFQWTWIIEGDRSVLLHLITVLCWICLGKSNGIYDFMERRIFTLWPRVYANHSVHTNKLRTSACTCCVCERQFHA